MHSSPESKQIVINRRIRLASLLCLALASTAGCPASSEDTRPPPDQLYFPTAMALSPDESVLFVVSGNSDLRYDSGTVDVIDLATVEALRSGEAGTTCEPDSVLPGVRRCDAAEAIVETAGARIGNFSTDIAVQELDSGDLRLFVSVRGDPSVTWADYSGGEITCGPSQEVPLCDNDHRILSLYNDPDLQGLISEPYGLLVDPLGGYLVITHLSLGTVSLVEAPTDGREPMLSDMAFGLFDADPETNVRAALGVAGRPRFVPASGQGEFDRVYVTGRTEDRVRMLSVARAVPTAPPTLALGEYFFLNGVDNLEDDADDSRGIAFNQDGTRFHAINRDPNFLHIYDTEDGPDGFPRNQYIGAVELCREPANIQVADVGRGDKAYISCFASGQVWVIDTRSRSVDTIIDVGRGPHALALAKSARQRLYVANFLENTISVVDIEPGSATENRVLVRLGSEVPGT